MYRALRPAFDGPVTRTGLTLSLCGLAIPVFYLPAFFYGPHTNFAVIDNWRFWIIHLWVEGFFELFATVLVAVMFLQMGLVSTRTATRLIYLDAILFLGGGIIGTGHHWYFTGQGTLNMGLAACFSALEVVPLTLLTLDAWDFVRLRTAQCRSAATISAAPDMGHLFPDGRRFLEFRRRGDIRLPDQPADRVLLRGGHATDQQSRPCLDVRCLRDVGPSSHGLLSEGHAIRHRMEADGEIVSVGFWGANVGLALMITLDLFPGGVIQLWDSIANGYWHARRLTFLMAGTYHKLEWLRMVGMWSSSWPVHCPSRSVRCAVYGKGSFSHAVNAACH